MWHLIVIIQNMHKTILKLPALFAPIIPNCTRKANTETQRINAINAEKNTFPDWYLTPSENALELIYILK